MTAVPTAAICGPDAPAAVPGVEHGPPVRAAALAWFALVALLPLAWMSFQGQTCNCAVIVGLAVHTGALSYWASRLRGSGVPLVWASVTVFGLASVLAASPSGRLESSALGESVFLYLLLGLFAAYDRQPGLQAIAAAALLMSAGVLTKPPIAISCVLAGFAFFWLHRRRSGSGSLGFALLMFTPATLCIASAGLLTFLTRGAVGASILSQAGDIGRMTPLALPGSQSAPGPVLEVLGMHWLVFPATVVLYRFCIQRTAACDVAFGFMLTAVTVLSFLSGMPQPLHRIDIFYLALGGAAALLVQSPPKRHFGSLAISASLLAAARWPGT